jgi:hypothetical protein
VKYKSDAPAPKPDELLDELTAGCEQIVEEFAGECDGILILIDEADKAPTAAHLGEFVKVFTERLSKRGCNRVSIGLAGISSVLNSLKESHESSLRVFQIMTLEPLLPRERIDVVRRALKDANSKNKGQTTISEPAEQMIAALSEGYPHFIQQFGYCAFDVDADGQIDVDDVLDGAFDREKGALQQLGLKYFQDLYFDQIGSDEYRQVLRCIAHVPMSGSPRNTFAIIQK